MCAVAAAVAATAVTGAADAGCAAAVLAAAAAAVSAACCKLPPHVAGKYILLIIVPSCGSEGIHVDVTWAQSNMRSIFWVGSESGLAPRLH